MYIQKVLTTEYSYLHKHAIPNEFLLGAKMKQWYFEGVLTCFLIWNETAGLPDLETFLLIKN